MNELRQITNPFPGLRPFETNEYRLFFGREGQSDALLTRLGRTRFLAVVGTSGSGKSSLVRAGLLPALRGGLMEEAGSGWRIAIMRPGGDPLGNLARVLAEKGMLDEAGGGLDGAEAEAVIEATLRGVSLGLIEAVRQARLSKRENVLVVVDQFEELFRFRAARPTTTDADDASAFVKLLLEAAAQRELPIYVVLTMRSDFLGDCSQFWGLPEAINEGQYLIPRMMRDERREAITGPIGVARSKVTEPLVNRLLNDVGDNPDQLPILQHALMRTWDEWKQKNPKHEVKHVGKAIDVCCYENIGGMANALSRHADEAYQTLPKERQLLAEKIFKCLTEKGLDNREIRRPMLLGDICEVVAASEEEVKQVIEVFRAEGRSFLMPPPKDPSTGAPVPLNKDSLIDISHESLIRGWDKLKTWVDEEAESARTYKRLADTALLKELKKEEYYRGSALQLALDWQGTNEPNKAWAKHYHPAYEKAIAFLKESAETNRQAEQDKKEQLENELKRARELADAQAKAAEVQTLAANRRKRYLVGLVFLTLVTIGSSAFALVGQRRALTQQTERVEEESRLKVKALAAETEAKNEREKAVQREGEAQRAKARAEELQQQAQKAKDLADDLRQQAQEQAAKLAISLKNEKVARQEALIATTTAQHERDVALGLQGKIQEQATTYGYFKTAFDDLAAGKRNDAAASLGKALEYFTKQKDTANIISTHINIGDVYASSDGDNAIESYDAAVSLIKAGKKDPKLLVSTLEKAGKVWADSDDDEEMKSSADYYTEAAAIYNKLGQKDDEAARWIDVGKVYSRSKNDEFFQNASDAFGNAIAVYTEPRDNLKMAETYLTIGEHYTALLNKESEEDDDEEGTPSEQQREAAVATLSEAAQREDKLRNGAVLNFVEASKLFKNTGDKARAAEMNFKAGKVLSESKLVRRKKEAVEKFILASREYKDAGDPDSQSSTLITAGDVYREAEDKSLWPKADEFYEQAVKIYRDLAKKDEEASTLRDIANLYDASDAPDQKLKALGYYQRAAKIYGETQNKGLESAMLIKAAAVLDKTEGADAQRQAAELYDQAVKVYDGDIPHQITALIDIGRSFTGSQVEGQTANAETYFNKAVELAERTGGKKAGASVYFNIGNAYFLRAPQLAIKNYERSRVISQEINDSSGQGMALYRLAMIYKRSTKTRPQVAGAVEQSLTFLNQALPEAESSGDKKRLADTLYAMGWLYEQKMEYKQALERFNGAVQLYRTMKDQRVRVIQTEASISRVTKKQGKEP